MFKLKNEVLGNIQGKCNTAIQAIATLATDSVQNVLNDESLKAIFKGYTLSNDELDVAEMVIRTWLAIASQCDDNLAMSILLSLISNGIDHVLKECDDAYDELAEGKLISAPLLQRVSMLWCDPYMKSDALTILKYPSRWFISRNKFDSELKTQTKREFKMLQHQLKGYLTYDYMLMPNINTNGCTLTEWYTVIDSDLGSDPIYVEGKSHEAASTAFVNPNYGITIDGIRHGFFTHYALFQEIRCVMEDIFSSYDASDIDYTGVPCTPGSTSDIGSIKLDKLEHLMKYEQAITHKVTYGNSSDQILPNFSSGNNCMEMHIVPKNWKKGRVIAPCSTVLASTGRIIFDKLVRHYHTVLSDAHSLINKAHVRITFEEQETNRELALLGSLAGDYCTIDLKNASDRNIPAVAKVVMPTLYSLLEPYRPHWIIDSETDQIMPCGSWMLAGFPATYIGECWYFASPCIYVILSTIRWNPRIVRELPKDVPWCVVCGDDIVIHKFFYQALMDILPVMGCVVNVEKSFVSSTNLFRESCGGYYSEGFTLDPVFFPRRNIKVKNGKLDSQDFRTEQGDVRSSSLSTMLSLTNRLARYPKAQLIAINYLLTHSNAKFTASSDACETGIRTELIEVRRKKLSPYCALKEDGSPNWEKTLRHDDSYLFEYYTLPTDAKNQYSRYRSYVAKGITSDLTVSEIQLFRYLDGIRYEQYLKEGPSYESPLDKLLGVSSRRVFV